MGIFGRIGCRPGLISDLAVSYDHYTVNFNIVFLEIPNQLGYCLRRYADLFGVVRPRNPNFFFDIQFYPSYLNRHLPDGKSVFFLFAYEIKCSDGERRTAKDDGDYSARSKFEF